MFADPNFMGNPKQVDRLCDLLKEQDLNMEFCALVRADAMATRPQLVKKMCQVGIRRFEMGIESPNVKDLSQQRRCNNRVHGEAVGTYVKTAAEQGEHLL